MSDQQLKEYRESTKCPDCDVAMTKKNKVSHHCHITGDFISGVYNICNLLLRYRNRRKGKNVTENYLIPVVFHNLRCYDAHLIIKHLSRFDAPSNAQVIASNMEKYIFFKTDGLRFVDSLQLLSCSFDGLVKKLEKGHENETRFDQLLRLHPDDE